MSELTETNQSPLMLLMQSAATDPNVDVEKMERIFNLYERDQDREAEKAYNTAMVEVQKSLEPVRRTMKNDQTSSKYADLSAVAQEVNEKFTAQGFSLSFYQGDSPLDEHIRVMVDVMHSQGHSKTRYVDMPLVNTGIGGKVMMTLTHATGSAFSYGRRYLTVLIANLPTPDNDGNGAAQKTIAPPQVRTINNILDENKSLRARFEKYLKDNDVPDIESIPANWFGGIIKQLREQAQELNGSEA